MPRAAAQDRRRGSSRRTPPSSRRGPELLRSGLLGHAPDLVCGRDAREHLLVQADDPLEQSLGPRRAAGQPELVGPHRLRLRPRDGLLECGQPQLLLQVADADLLLEDTRALRRPEQALRLQPVVAEALHRHSSAPLRQMYTYATARMTTKNRNSKNANQPSAFSVTASG